MKPPPMPGYVSLTWVTNREYKVSVSDVNDPGECARAAEQALAASGIFGSYGVILESIAIGCVPSDSPPPKMRAGETPTYP